MITEKQFKMSISKTRATGIILEKELSTDEVYAILMDYKNENEQLKEENTKIKEQLKNCTKKAKEEIRKQAENDAIRWANIGR